MPINAVCPECQSHFRLHDGMRGKTMRCTVCQEVFVVKESSAPPPIANGGERTPPTDAPPRTRTDAPSVASRSGNVSDFVPLVHDVTPAAPVRPAPPPVPSARPRDPARIKPPTAADFPWDEGPPGTRSNGAPKEVTWSPELELAAPPAPEEAEPEYEERADDLGRLPDESDRVRPPRKRGRILLLAFLVLFIVIGLGAGGFFGVRYYSLAPQRAFDAAKKDYEAGQYPAARKQFEALVGEYPNHSLVPEARFFAALAAMRHQAGSVMGKEDPRPGVEEWNRFLTLIQEPELAPFATKERYGGVDIWDAGYRLLENLIAKAGEVYNQDTPDEAEGWLQQAVAIEKELDQFRQDSVGKPERQLAEMTIIRRKIDGARQRLAGLAQIQGAVGEGTDEQVAEVMRLAKQLGLENDPGFKAILDRIERKVQEKAAYRREPQPIPPTTLPDDGLTSLLFAPRFDHAENRKIPGLTAVFYCLARGVLYALDEADGRVLWAARTGLDADVMPVRVRASDQNPELVLVASNTGNQFGITARAGRDGRPLWHQALAAPCLGPPVVIASNAYVSLDDRDGTVLEIVVATGDVVGRITVGRPLGPVMAARPGTSHLYVPADSHAVYVFDVDRHGPEPDFKKLDPALLGVLNTGHPAGTLRGVPVFSNADPNEPGPKFLVLGQAAGLDRMKLRTFRLPDDTDAKPDAANVYEIALPGWASFPPYCDGEKLAVVTDRGEFGLYGLALDQNRDDMLFSFQTPHPQSADPRPSRGQVVMAEEGTFWIMAGGQLRKFRFGINMAEGVRAVPYGEPVPVGEPLQAPQVNARGDTFVVVTQDGMACRATAVDPLTGEVRWRRELGLMAKGDPLRIGDAILVLDEGGGFYRIDVGPLTARANAAWLLDEKWLIVQPVAGYAAHTGLVPGPDETAFALLVGEGEHAGKLLVRKYSGKDRTSQDFSVSAPAAPAGPPVVSGQMFLIPLADGNLYRVPLGGAKALEQGPSWRGDRLPATARCFLVPLNDDELYATDGNRVIARLHWSSTSQFFETRGKLTLTERPGAAPVVIPGSPPRLIVADGRGNLTAWDGDQLRPPVLRSWRAGDKNPLPAGRIEDGLRLVTDGDGRAQITYTVGGRLVVLPVDADGPKWVGPMALKALEGRAAFDNGRAILTDRAGTVRVLDARTGRPTGDEFRLTGSHAFASAAVPIGPNRILVPLADGTLVLGELKTPVKGKPPGKKPDDKDRPKEDPKGDSK